MALYQDDRCRPVLWIVALMLVTALAACATPRKGPSVNVPNPERLAAAYPEFAMLIDMSGRVDLSCTGDREGSLRDCRVVQAKPAGMGFEEAALSLAGDLRLVPTQRGDVTRLPEVQFTIPFTLGPRPPSPQPWTEEDPSPEALRLAREIVGRWPAPARPDPRTLDVALDRADWVADLIWMTDRSRDEERREAWMLALARLQSLDQLRMLAVGQRRAAPLAQDLRSLSAQDRLIAAEDARALRLRRAYCQHYGCGQFESVF